MVATRNTRGWLRQNQWFILACLIVAIVKLWITSDLEIVAKNKPLDELWYARSARDFYWFSDSYDHLTFCRQPGFPVWIALVGVTGIPLRVAMELLVIGASLSLSLALTAVGTPTLAGFLTYLLMAFHPYTFQLNCILLQDMFYGPLLWLCLAALILAYANRSVRNSAIWAGVAGLFFSVLWNTRPETPLIIGMLAVACLLFAPFHRADTGSWRNGVGRVARTTLIISAGIAAITTAICAANYLRYGLFVAYDLDAPGYRNAMNALLSIRSEKPIRHVSVSRAAMEHAARVSPSFRQIQPRIDAWARNWYSRYEPPAPGEIVAGQFYWAFRRAAGQCGFHSSAPAASAFYQEIADEIDAACSKRLIPCRRAVIPIITSDLWAFRKHIPASFLRIAGTFVIEGRQLPYEKDDLATTSRAVRRLFDEVANRRVRLTRYPKVIVNGSAHLGSQRLLGAEIRDRRGLVLASTQPRHGDNRQHKRETVTDVSRVPRETEFRLVFTPTLPLPSGDFVLIAYDGSEYTIPLDQITSKRQGSLTGQSPGEFIRYRITSAKNLGPLHHMRARARDHAYRVYEPIAVLLSLTGLAGMMAWIIVPSKRLNGYLLPVLLFLLFAVVSRVGLFTILDATSWVADRIRYIYPVIPVYMATMVTLTFAGVQSVVFVVWQQRMRHERNPDPRGSKRAIR